MTEANPNNFQVLFDDHFAEASPREFGVYKAPSTSHVLDYESDSDLEEEDLADGDLSAIKPGMFEQCKMVRASH